MTQVRGDLCPGQALQDGGGVARPHVRARQRGVVHDDALPREVVQLERLRAQDRGQGEEPGKGLLGELGDELLVEVEDNVEPVDEVLFRYALSVSGSAGSSVRPARIEEDVLPYM